MLKTVGIYTALREQVKRKWIYGKKTWWFLGKRRWLHVEKQNKTVLSVTGIERECWG